MHIGMLEGNSVGLGDNCSAQIWIAHWTQENLVQIIFERDEDLVLEILRIERKMKKKVDRARRS
jgi:hypothetical protein